MFTNLMIAMGREGDIEGVNSILKSVYKIDVDLLAELDEEEVETPTFYEKDSPLRPTQRLLFTVAHVFGTNNRAGQAYQLVDYISRHYDLPVSGRVWQQVYEWTFILQLRRTNRQHQQGQDVGKIPRAMLERLWQIMTDEPYNIKPDVPLLSLQIKSHRQGLLLGPALTDVREIRSMVDRDCKQLDLLAKDVLNWISKWSDTPNANDILPRDWFDLRRRFVTYSVQVERDVALLFSAVHSIFKERYWPGSRKETEWERRTLPMLFEEFSEYVSHQIRYITKNGVICLDGNPTRSTVNFQISENQLRKVGMIRAAIDVDDHDLMVQRMQVLPLVMAEAEKRFQEPSAPADLGSQEGASTRPDNDSLVAWIEEHLTRGTPAWQFRSP